MTTALFIIASLLAQEEARATDNPANASYLIRVDQGNQSSYGSGTAISRNLIVTNAHVVGAVGTSVTISQMQTNFVGQVIESNQQSDLAFVYADGELRFTEYSDTDPVVGQSCKLYGYAYAGPLRKGEGKVTHDAVDDTGSPRTWLSIPVYNGDSGGGVFNEKNSLVAVTHGKRGDTGECSALPISLVIQLMSQYKSRVGQGWQENVKCDKCGAYHKKGVELTQL